MTYSNRPTTSPYQHRSEMNDRVSDSNLINKINPFVVGEMNLPGTWSDPYPYAQYYLDRKDTSSIECAVEPSCNTEKSPICSTEITAGDNTIEMCRPTKPNLPMCRPLYPERNIDPGMWVYNQSAASAASATAAAVVTQKDALMYTGIFLILIFILNRN